MAGVIVAVVWSMGAAAGGALRWGSSGATDPPARDGLHAYRPPPGSRHRSGYRPEADARRTLRDSGVAPGPPRIACRASQRRTFW